MTTDEFSTEFDVKYNNTTSNQAPGLNGYEKSVFLTTAEKQLLHEYFNPMLDNGGNGFDGSPRRQIDFSSITITESLSDIGSPHGYTRIHPNSFIFKISAGGNGLQFNQTAILNEFVTVVKVIDGTNHYDTLTVKPLSFNEYQRVMLKPYKYPPKGMAWRLINNGEYVEIISPVLIGGTVSYSIRYVRNPAPIILEDLSGYGVSIDGVTNVTNCELPEEMHHEILERAVTLAKLAWQGTTMTQAAIAAQAGK